MQWKHRDKRLELQVRDIADVMISTGKRDTAIIAGITCSTV